MRVDGRKQSHTDDRRAILAATALPQAGEIPARVRQTLDAKDYTAAARAVGEQLRRSPDREPGFLLLAIATMRLGRLNDSYKILGLDYALGGELRESARAFARAASLRAGDWENRYYLGRALFEWGRFRGARDSLERAVERNGASAKARRGQAQERLDDPERAAASYRRAVEACGTGRECA